MEIESLTTGFEALSHPRRLDVFRLLMRRYPHHIPASEIAQVLDIKANTLSAYLGALMRAGLIAQTRHGTSLRYTIAMKGVQKLINGLVVDCCRGRPDLCEVFRPDMDGKAMSHDKENVLFICTGNSARSIFAESILRDLAGDRFNVYSAGTRPFSSLNPDAVTLLRAKGHDIEGLSAKNISLYQREDAPRMDYVFTVCDRAANEECPAWQGQPITGHFSTPDPVAVEGSEAERALAFQRAYGSLFNRITLFVERHRVGFSRLEAQAAVDHASAYQGDDQ